MKLANAVPAQVAVVAAAGGAATVVAAAEVDTVVVVAADTVATETGLRQTPVRLATAQVLTGWLRWKTCCCDCYRCIFTAALLICGVLISIS